MCFATVAQAADKTDLVIALDADIDTLHATNYSTGVEQDVLNQIYDTLMYYNPDGKHDPEPRIAESYEISEDGLDYTFHLRDCKWSDGEPVKAGDFECAWKRALNPDTAAEYAYQLFYLI